MGGRFREIPDDLSSEVRDVTGACTYLGRSAESAFGRATYLPAVASHVGVAPDGFLPGRYSHRWASYTVSKCYLSLRAYRFSGRSRLSTERSESDATCVRLYREKSSQGNPQLLAHSTDRGLSDRRLRIYGQESLLFRRFDYFFKAPEGMAASVQQSPPVAHNLGLETAVSTFHVVSFNVNHTLYSVFLYLRFRVKPPPLSTLEGSDKPFLQVFKA